MKGKEDTKRATKALNPCERENTIPSFVERSLAPKRMKEMASHIEDCVRCQEELGRQQESDARLLAQLALLKPTEFPVFDVKEVQALFQKEASASAPSWRESWRRWFGPLVPAVGFMGMVISMLLWVPPQPQNVPRPAKRGHVVTPMLLPKGERVDLVYAQRKAGKLAQKTQIASKSAETTMSYKDAIQFVYHFSKHRYMIIVGVNEEGKFFPLTRTSKTIGQFVKVSQKGSFPKGTSFILDRYLGVERYFTLIAEVPFSWTHVKKAIRKAWAKERNVRTMTVIPGAWTTHTWLIHKRVRK